MTEILYGLLSVAVFLLLAVTAVSVYLLRYVVQPKRRSLVETLPAEAEKGHLSGWNELKKENFEIASYDGYILHGTYVSAGQPPFNRNTKRFVVVVHGHTCNRIDSVKYSRIFLQAGYNVILYDNRGHGENKRVPVTMGLRESRDCAEIIAWLRKRFGSDISIGLHGESMGSATVNMTTDYCTDLQFVISDCGYADLSSYFRDAVHQVFHLPEFLVSVSSFLCRVVYRFNFKSIRPVDAVRRSRIPHLFIHGTGDHYVPCKNAQILYDACSAPKKLYFADGADHALSYDSNPEKYAEIVTDFIKSTETTGSAGKDQTV
jgi:fermentation-respiration switch protein FrsA (DUF1100 family)